MDKQRQRIAAFDEENKVLAAVAEPLYYKDKEGSSINYLPFEFFLRLPKGIAKAPPEKDGLVVFNDLIMLRYPGYEGTNVLVAAAIVGERKDGKLRAGEWPYTEFREQVKGALTQFLKKNLPKAEYQQQVKKPTSLKGDVLPNVTFDTADFGDGVWAYFLQRDARQVAVIYQVPPHKKDDPATLSAIDMSLKSLDIGHGAYAKRVSFATTKRY